MPPTNNQNGYQAPPESDNPYGFFLDPQQTPKKSLLPGGNSSLLRVILIALGVLSLLVVIAVFLSLRAKSNDTSPLLVSVVKDQQEIIRLSTDGALHVESSSLKNFTASAVTTTTSAQHELITYLAKRGNKIDTKALALTKNTQTDQILANAVASSTYDAAFKTTMQSLLGDYQKDIERANAASTQASARKILDRDAGSTTLLLQQLSQ